VRGRGVAYEGEGGEEDESDEARPKVEAGLGRGVLGGEKSEKGFDLDVQLPPMNVKRSDEELTETTSFLANLTSLTNVNRSLPT
jgi:hypothetical protein